MWLLLQSPLADERNWPLLGMGALALAYVVLRPMMRRKRDPLDRPPQFGSMAQQRAVERQMQNLLVDLTEMARQISAQLDTRAARLDALIRDADEKIAELRATTQGDASVGAATGQGASAASHGAFPRMVDASDECEADGSAESNASALASLSSPIHEPDPRHAEVYALADAGRAPREIAAQLNRPSGEIELILALRPRD